MFSWPSEEKDSGISAFSKAEAWQHSTIKKLLSVKSFEIVLCHETPSKFFDHVVQYVHVQTGKIHKYFNVTCLLLLFFRYLL